MLSRVYVTIGRPSVRLSVRPFVGLFVCPNIRPPYSSGQEISINCCTVGAQQQRRRSTALSSICEQCHVYTADVGSWTKTCLYVIFVNRTMQLHVKFKWISYAFDTDIKTSTRKLVKPVLLHLKHTVIIPCNHDLSTTNHAWNVCFTCIFYLYYFVSA